MTKSIKEKSTLPFHFLFMAIGEILKVDNYVNAQRLQNFVANEEAFGGFRIPLSDIRLALSLMEDSGFIKKINDEDYSWSNHDNK